MKDSASLNYNESRILRILKEDSRRSASEISEMVGLSRSTVSKTISNLVDRGKIRAFTVSVDTEEDDIMILAEVESLFDIPEEFLVESVELSDGTFLAVLRKGAMYEKFPARSMKIVHKLTRYDENELSIDMYCDYCRNRITDEPIKLSSNTMTYLACGTECKRGLENLLHTTR